MAGRNPIVGIVGVAVLLAAGIGVQEQSFASLNASNQTTNATASLKTLTGSVIELWPYLLLALVALWFVSLLR